MESGRAVGLAILLLGDCDNRRFLVDEPGVWPITSPEVLAKVGKVRPSWYHKEHKAAFYVAFVS